MGLKVNKASSGSKSLGFNEMGQNNGVYRRSTLTISPISLTVNAEYANRTLESHALFRHTYNLRVILTERNPFHSRWELPRIQALPRRHLPKLHAVVRRPRY